MSTTLSQLNLGLPPGNWSAPPVDRSNNPSWGQDISSATRGRVLSASAGIRPDSSQDVDGWTNAVTSPLLEEANAY